MMEKHDVMSVRNGDVGSLSDGTKIQKAYGFGEEGIYIYKRPVRSGSQEHAMLVQHAGTVFHHVVVYLKYGNEAVKALEYGPGGSGMDVTDNILQEVDPGPVHIDSPEMPEDEHLPMLHIKAEHSSLDEEHVRRAIEFVSKKKYHALRRNCIAFADFIVRVLTKGKVKHATLMFDAVCGHVPEQDSPLLQMLYLMQQLTWFDVCDGSKILKEFLDNHGEEFYEFVEKMKGQAGEGESKKAGLLALPKRSKPRPEQASI